jgi:anthranilate phosphoribosyltransferase
VAVGKFGVRPVPADALGDILTTLSRIDAAAHEEVPKDVLLQRASFLGALFVKAEISKDEMRVLVHVAADWPAADNSDPGRVRAVGGATCSAAQVLAYVTKGGVKRKDSDVIELSNFAFALLSDDALTREQARELGGLLYSPANNSLTAVQVKALISHVMRVRHESEDELIGLAMAAAASVNPAFKSATAMAGDVDFLTAHLAEPFDGTSTWDLLTPLIARHLKVRYDICAVLATGASSGPKYGPNLLDVARELGVPIAKSGEELAACIGECEFGVAVDQMYCSHGLDAWVSIRRAIIKRPALATTEKYVDVTPGGRATIFVSSAFHGNYIEKMALVAEALEYPGYIIVSKGVEGSIGLGVGSKRRAMLLVGARDAATGAYARKEIDAPSAEGDAESDAPIKGSASASRTAELSRTWIRNDESSGDLRFDARVKATLNAFDAAMEFLLPRII